MFIIRYYKDKVISVCNCSIIVVFVCVFWRLINIKGYLWKKYIILCNMIKYVYYVRCFVDYIFFCFILFKKIELFMYMNVGFDMYRIRIVLRNIFFFIWIDLDIYLDNVLDIYLDNGYIFGFRYVWLFIKIRSRVLCRSFKFICFERLDW